MPRPVSSIAWNDLYIGYTKPTTLHARFAPKPKIIMTVSAARPPTTCQLSSPVACASAWIPSLCRIVSANPRCCSSLVRSFEAGAAFSSFGLRLAPRLERAGERCGERRPVMMAARRSLSSRLGDANDVLGSARRGWLTSRRLRTIRRLLASYSRWSSRVGAAEIGGSG